MHSPIVTPAGMRAAENAAFARGITAAALMEKAGAGIARAIRRFFPCAGKCIVFAGKGHNAGDAFVAARQLAGEGWEIETRLIFPKEKLSALTKKKLSELEKVSVQKKPSLSALNPPTVILDGLLGLGANPPLREPIRGACREINSLGRNGACIFAVDLPSGLNGETGEADEACVVANCTVTIGSAKSGLVADAALDFVGRLEVVVLDDLRLDEFPFDQEVSIPQSLRACLPPRKFSSYKNQFGRIGIVAGSRGFTGAALMCSSGALRAGAGLVELFVPENIYEIVASAAAPEVMVKPVRSYARLLEEPMDVWAVGPGLGQTHAAAILRLIREAKQPMVIDADGLNILGKKMPSLKKVKGSRLLTPHPGEMQRLFPDKKRSRVEWAKAFCQQYPVTLLLKGSRTLVVEAGQPLSFNSTGNPGMATGGMGDVLTGVCAGLLGARLTPNEAARVGAWVCGRAAEIAIFNGLASEESLLPSDLLDHLGAAFKELR